MSTRAIPITAIDQLHQIRDELSVIWLALGNTADMAEDYMVDVREALYGTTNRLRDVCRAMETGGQCNG
ncbi:hypothetical protein C7441_12539 [Pseudaminobacter salicylatoxidans]|uniref:Uncharacterized protein n=1 Tax=Pseudaminobacter salicylatoxidans TaxID=93369 RepID=A0A316BM52_PSESE|nr:hypothetical protein [Pseudaminobacter salicylatoxidans]PWJ73855.1 hypothetical protein C7441_12539 [Pseudaminobacter salicylatoxidans]